MRNEDADLRPDGGVRRSERPRRRRRNRRAWRAIGAWTPIRRSRSRNCTRRSACRTTRLPLIVLIGGLVGCLGGLRPAVLGVGRRESVERRRQAAAQLARVHPDHFETHHPRRRAVGGARHAGLERAADAVSPGLQRVAVRARQPQSVFPLHRGEGRAVRPRERRGPSFRRSTRGRCPPLRTRPAARRSTAERSRTRRVRSRLCVLVRFLR